MSVHVNSNLPICVAPTRIYFVLTMNLISNSVSPPSERCTSRVPYLVSTYQWSSWVFVFSAWCKPFCMTICVCSHAAASAAISFLSVAQKILYLTTFSQYFPPWTFWCVLVSVIKAAAKVGVRDFPNSSFSKYILTFGMRSQYAPVRFVSCGIPVVASHTLWPTSSALNTESGFTFSHTHSWNSSS